jgi:hypothetical protein
MCPLLPSNPGEPHSGGVIGYIHCAPDFTVTSRLPKWQKGVVTVAQQKLSSAQVVIRISTFTSDLVSVK